MEKEINKASDFLRKRGDKNDSERLKEIYTASAGGTIGLTPLVLIVSMYRTINERRKLKTPRFITNKQELIEFLSSP